MICRQCGAEVDTRRKRPDGTVQCYHCRKIYYPRPRPESTQQPIRAHRPAVEPKKQVSFMKRRFLKLPVWLWFVFATILAVITLPAIVVSSVLFTASSSSQTVVADPQLLLSTPQPTAVVSVEKEALPTATMPVQTAATVETSALFPQTIFDAKGVKITLTSFAKYGTFGPEIKITVENNSGMNLYLVTGELYCDGWQLADFTGLFELADGSKAADTIYIYESTLDDCGLSISDLKEVTFKNARINNNDNYSQEYTFDMQAILQR